jgi:hypothetical protein
MALSSRTIMRRYLLLWGSVILILSALSAIRLWRLPTDIWWTPAALAVPINESHDRVRVYIREEPLENILSGTRLLVAGESGAAPVGPMEVTMRFNNRDRVRAERLPMALATGLGIGVALMLLLTGIVGMGPRAGEGEPTP